MKKLLFAISAFALLMGVNVSCQKSIDSMQGVSNNTELTITATISNNGTKVSYEEDGTTHALKPEWEVNDIIIGFDGDSNTYGYQVTSVDGTTGKATLALITSGNYVGSKTTNPSDGTKMYMFYAPGKKPSDISSKSLTVSLASQSKDVVPALMMASATVSGSSLSLAFTNKTAVIGIKSPTMAAASTSYTSIALSGTGINTEVVFNLDGSNLQATYQTPGTITKTVEFTSDATTKKGAEITYIVACPLSTAADLTFTASNGEKFSKASKTMSAGNYYYMTPTFAPGIPEGALGGLFSVSATTKVHFSKGNLYYDGSAYKFEDNQYSSATEWQTNHVSHFYWSKEASVACAEEYSESGTSAGDDIFFTNADATTPKSGFTVNGATGVWRTLSGGSSGEWQYLLSTRSVKGGTGEGKSYQRATINSDATGVYGVIIYPDNYTSQTTATSYTSSQWTAMESAGCVFLPAAGFRNDSDVYNVGYGLYSSSTAGGEEDAYGLFFYSDNFKPHNCDMRENGCSVRLVCAAQ